jgi:hypothetical protein
MSAARLAPRLCICLLWHFSNQLCNNLQVFSRHAAEMSLCLMRADGSGYLEVALDPITNKSGDVWHVQLSGLKVRRFLLSLHV